MSNTDKARQHHDAIAALNESADRTFWKCYEEIRDEWTAGMAESIMEMDAAVNATIDERVRAALSSQPAPETPMDAWAGWCAALGLRLTAEQARDVARLLEKYHCIATPFLKDGRLDWTDSASRLAGLLKWMNGQGLFHRSYLRRIPDGFLLHGEPVNVDTIGKGGPRPEEALTTAILKVIEAKDDRASLVKTPA